MSAQKKCTLVVVLIVGVSLFYHGFIYSQTWSPRAPIPTERWNPASVVLDEKIYVIGGQEGVAPYVALATVEVYDPVTDTWEAKAPLPTPRWGLVAETVNNKIYAIGGRGGSFSGGHFALDVVEEYNPLTDSWISKTSMPTPRGWAGSAVVDDAILVFGGRGVQSDEVAIEKYTPSMDSWTTEAPMPQPRSTFMTASVNNRVYIIGGWGSNLVQEYDLSSKEWTTKTPMPTARGGSGIGVVHDRIYVVGGRGGNADECESYDPEHDRWTRWIPMPTRREGVTAAVFDGKLYAVTGSVPLAEGGLPYLTANEEASDLIKPIIQVVGYQIDDSQENNNGVLNTGESANLIVLFENIGYAATGLTVELQISDEHITVEDADGSITTLEPFQPAGNTEDPFYLTAGSDFPVHWTTVNVYISAEGGYVDTLAFDLPVGNPSILLIDDDGGQQYEKAYHDALHTAEQVYAPWEIQSRGCPNSDITGYETVIWLTGDKRDSTLTQNEQHMLTQHLHNGGHLFLSGQNIGYDLIASGSKEDSLFFTDYLHAAYINDTCQETFLKGIEGDPISGTSLFLPIDENQVSPSVIAPREDASQVLAYFPSGSTAAIKYEGGYKLVYFALGFEGIRAMTGNDEDIRTALIENILQWFHYEPTKSDVNQDGIVNILDVIAAINIILGVLTPNPSQVWAADCNTDGMVNILDVIGIVNVVLGIGSCPP